MERYEVDLAVAYVRGCAKQGQIALLPEHLATAPAAELTQQEFETLLELAEKAQLRMYHFKKKDMLPRVQAVMGFLKSVQPESLLDVGSGRGAFLYPFLLQFPWANVTSVDLLPHRVQTLQALTLGGVENLTALQQDICHWDAPDKSFDTVTLLEVLEHIPNVEQAIRAAVRLARRYVVVTVPSKEDNNPEHIHLLTKELLTKYFTAAGCKKLHFSGVNGHLMMSATIGD